MRDIGTWDTLLTSCKVMSFPPVILYTTPVADWMEDPIKGARVACSAASSARFLLEETPTPSIAVPEFFITAFTSAKSTFTSPGIYRRKYKIVMYSTCFHYCCIDYSRWRHISQELFTAMEKPDWPLWHLNHRGSRPWMKQRFLGKISGKKEKV